MATVRIPKETHELLLGLSALDGRPIGEWITIATKTQIKQLKVNGQLDIMKKQRADRLAAEEERARKAREEWDDRADQLDLIVGGDDDPDPTDAPQTGRSSARAVKKTTRAGKSQAV